MTSLVSDQCSFVLSADSVSSNFSFLFDAEIEACFVTGNTEMMAPLKPKTELWLCTILCLWYHLRKNILQEAAILSQLSGYVKSRQGFRQLEEKKLHKLI